MDGLKKCPFCGEMIKAEAIKCKYCCEMLNEPPPAQNAAPTPPPAQNAAPTPPPAQNAAPTPPPAQTIIVQQNSQGPKAPVTVMAVFLLIAAVVQAIFCTIPFIGMWIGLLFYGPLYLVTFILCIVCLCRQRAAAGCLGMMAIPILSLILPFVMPFVLLGNPFSSSLPSPRGWKGTSSKTASKSSSSTPAAYVPSIRRVEPFKDIEVSRYWMDTDFTDFPLRPLPEPYFSHFSTCRQSKHVKIDNWRAGFNSTLTLQLTNTSSRPIYGIAFNLDGRPYVNSEKDFSWFAYRQPWMPGESITITGTGANMYKTDAELPPARATSSAWFINLMIVFADDFYFPSAITDNMTVPRGNLELYRGIRSGCNLMELKEKLHNLTGQQFAGVRYGNGNVKYNGWELGDPVSYDNSGILRTKIGDNWALFYFTRNRSRLYKVVIVFSPNYTIDEITNSMQGVYGSFKDGVIRTNFESGTFRAFGKYNAKTAEKNGVVAGLLALDQKPLEFVKGTVSRQEKYGSDLYFHGFPRSEWRSFSQTARFSEYPASLSGKNGTCRFAAIIYDKIMEENHIRRFDLRMQCSAERHRLAEMLKNKKQAFRKQEVFGNTGSHEPDSPMRTDGLLKMPELSASVRTELDTVPENMRYPLALWAKYQFFAQKFRNETAPAPKELLRQQCQFLHRYVKGIAPAAAKFPEDERSVANDRGTMDDYMLLVIRWWRRNGTAQAQSPAEAPSPGQAQRAAEAPSPGQTQRAAKAPSPGQTQRAAEAPSPGQAQRAAEAPSPGQTQRAAEAPSPKQANKPQPRTESTRKVIKAIEQIGDICTVKLAGTYVAFPPRKGSLLQVNVEVSCNSEKYRLRVLEALSAAGFRQTSNVRSGTFVLSMTGTFYEVPEEKFDEKMFANHFCGVRKKYPGINMSIQSPRGRPSFTALQVVNTPLVVKGDGVYRLWSADSIQGNYYLARQSRAFVSIPVGGQVKFSSFRSVAAPAGTRVFTPGSSRKGRAINLTQAP